MVEASKKKSLEAAAAGSKKEGGGGGFCHVRLASLWWKLEPGGDAPASPSLAGPADFFPPCMHHLSGSLVQSCHTMLRDPDLYAVNRLGMACGVELLCARTST